MANRTLTKGMFPFGSTLVSAIVAASCLLALGQSALAQATASSVSHVVVRESQTALRSGPGLDWYAVATLEPGTVLRADANVEGWYKVEYPAGLPAVVRTLKGELRENDTVVVLTSNDALGSFNMEKPFTEDCYKRIFAERQLPPGTRLKYLGPIENRRGELAGYKVVAPEGAKGYVLPADVRPATNDEIRAFEGMAPASESVPSPGKSIPPAGKTDEPLRSITPAQTPEETTTKAPSDSRPVTDTEQDARESDGALPAMEMGETTTPATPRAFKPGSLEALDAAYKRVMAQDIETAEFGQLIDEYGAYRDALPDTEDASIERDYVTAKMEVLEIRADLQDNYRALAALEKDTESAEHSLNQLVKGIQTARGYIVVGRLAPSIVYDGQRLPRMFRVTSVDANSGGRTLAYILPVEELGLVGKLGAIVGIMGEDDPTARRGEVRVIRPTVAEVLETE